MKEVDKIMSEINKITADIRKQLKADCSNCFGLCCVALNLIKSNDFAINKPAGIPCINLQPDYNCKIHSSLREKGFKGCTVFDCLGAGQVVSKVIFKDQSWKDNSEIKQKMFLIFPIMEQIHEMIAYSAEALSYDIPDGLRDHMSVHLKELQSLAGLDAESLESLDLDIYRSPLNGMLLKTSKYIRGKTIDKLSGSKKNQDYDHERADWMGKNLRGKDLRAFNLRGAYLIAADLREADLRAVDFIGADMREADLRGSNLSTAMFLTQMQINSANGDSKTILPAYLKKPFYWKD